MIQPTGAKLYVPTADFWHVRDGKILEFLLAQMGVLPDVGSAVTAPAS